jgi:hypothetical protein
MVASKGISMLELEKKRYSQNRMLSNKSSPDRFCNPGCIFSLKPISYAATGSFTSSPKA